MLRALVPLKEGVTRKSELSYIIYKRHLEELYVLYSLGKIYPKTKKKTLAENQDKKIAKICNSIKD